MRSFIMFSATAERETWLSRAWRPPYPLHILNSFLGPFVTFIVLEGLTIATNIPWLNGSFGAAVVIMYAIPTSVAAIPRHVLGGQVVSALVAIAIAYALPEPSSTWIRSSLSVALSTMVMKVLGVSYPPGGATAYIIAHQSLSMVSLLYLVFPLIIGSTILIIFTIVFEKLRRKEYPKIWI